MKVLEKTILKKNGFSLSLVDEDLHLPTEELLGGVEHRLEVVIVENITSIMIFFGICTQVRILCELFILCMLYIVH